MRIATKLAFLFFSWIPATNTIAQVQETSPFVFSYDFQSGARLTGSFDGFQRQPESNSVTVVGFPTIATFEDPTSDVSFTWDTRRLTDASSQASLIDRGEYSFVSFDGNAMDFVLSSGIRTVEPIQVFLQNNTINNASTNNVLPIDIQEEFVPSRWSLMSVPEPSPSGLEVWYAFVCGWLIVVRRIIS
ncbi:MAG: hypothetical protein KDB27_14830 [Planctomycetales bacterium]|nr:hypothetical protein [Planctomycetales bacterium]